MRVLITGSKGFIGRNLIAELNNNEDIEVLAVHRETTEKELNEFTKVADFVVHLAGENRPENNEQFIIGNVNFTEKIINLLKEHNNTCPILYTSSIQATFDNPYGKSKKTAENLLFEYGKANEVKVLIYRLPNVFGKWSKPNYNSAIATFCYNIARDIPIEVTDRKIEMNLVYIDDVVKEFVKALSNEENRVDNFCEVPMVYRKTLGEIVDLIYSFKQSRIDRTVPDLSDSFIKKLYSTYLTFIPEDQFNYNLTMHKDERGSFTEFIRTPDRGQVSVNVSKPGITKGEHWHHTKNEKFLVVSGKGVIRFRKIDTDEIIEYYVDDQNFEVIDIPPGYTHNIENLGNTDMVTVMWANEMFDPDNPDTYYLEVNK